MKNILKYGIFALMSVFILTSCDPQDGDDHKLGPEPSPSDLEFKITATSTKNVYTLEDISSRAGVAVWDMGNYSKDKGVNVTAQYPFKGEYTITMTLYTTGGSTSISKNIVIEDDNFDLLDTPMFNTLTGGFDDPDGRTWVFDKETAGHFGVGPATATKPEWWSCPPNGKAECSLYDQEFTFSMSKTTGLKLVWTNKGKVYTNGAGKDDLAKKGYPNASEPPAGDWDVEFTPADSYGYVMNEAGMLLEILDGGFMGHYTGSSSYTIQNEMDEDNEVLYLKNVSAVETGNSWWYRFVPKQ